MDIEKWEVSEEAKYYVFLISNVISIIYYFVPLTLGVFQFLKYTIFTFFSRKLIKKFGFRQIFRIFVIIFCTLRIIHISTVLIFPDFYHSSFFHDKQTFEPLNRIAPDILNIMFQIIFLLLALHWIVVYRRFRSAGVVTKSSHYTMCCSLITCPVGFSLLLICFMVIGLDVLFFFTDDLLKGTVLRFLVHLELHKWIVTCTILPITSLLISLLFIVRGFEKYFTLIHISEKMSPKKRQLRNYLFFVASFGVILFFKSILHTLLFMEPIRFVFYEYGLYESVFFFIFEVCPLTMALFFIQKSVVKTSIVPNSQNSNIANHNNKETPSNNVDSGNNNNNTITIDEIKRGYGGIAAKTSTNNLTPVQISPNPNSSSPNDTSKDASNTKSKSSSSFISFSLFGRKKNKGKQQNSINENSPATPLGSSGTVRATIPPNFSPAYYTHPQAQSMKDGKVSYLEEQDENDENDDKLMEKQPFLGTSSKSSGAKKGKKKFFRVISNKDMDEDEEAAQKKKEAAEAEVPDFIGGADDADALQKHTPPNSNNNNLNPNLMVDHSRTNSNESYSPQLENDRVKPEDTEESSSTSGSLSSSSENHGDDYKFYEKIMEQSANTKKTTEIITTTTGRKGKSRKKKNNYKLLLSYGAVASGKANGTENPSNNNNNTNSDSNNMLNAHTKRNGSSDYDEMTYDAIESMYHKSENDKGSGSNSNSGSNLNNQAPSILYNDVYQEDTAQASTTNVVSNQNGGGGMIEGIASGIGGILGFPKSFVMPSKSSPMKKGSPNKAKKTETKSRIFHPDI